MHFQTKNKHKINDTKGFQQVFDAPIKSHSKSLIKQVKIEARTGKQKIKNYFSTKHKKA